MTRHFFKNYDMHTTQIRLFKEKIRLQTVNFLHQTNKNATYTQVKKVRKIIFFTILSYVLHFIGLIFVLHYTAKFSSYLNIYFLKYVYFLYPDKILSVNTFMYFICLKDGFDVFCFQTFYLFCFISYYVPI